MDDQFDKDLKKRIREVFDNYEDTSADKGWMLLREKFPEKAKKRPVAWMWWSSAAAVLLLFLGILWFKQSPEKQQHFTAIKKGGSNTAPARTSHANNDQNTVDNTTAQQPVHTLASATNHNATVKSSVAALPNQAAISNKNQGLLATNAQNNATGKNPGNPAIVNDQNNNSPAVNATTLASAGRPADTNPANPLNAAKFDTTNASASKSNIIAATPGINMQQPDKFNKQLL